MCWRGEEEDGKDKISEGRGGVEWWERKWWSVRGGRGGWRGGLAGWERKYHEAGKKM